MTLWLIVGLVVAAALLLMIGIFCLLIALASARLQVFDQDAPR